MNRFLLLLAIMAAQSFAEELPHRTDVPDAILDVQRLPVGAPVERPIILQYNTFEKSFPKGKRESIEAKDVKISKTKDGVFVLEFKDEKKAESSAKSWRELFNGKDLHGWKTIGSAIWKAEDGVLIGGQFGDPKRSGLIRTEDSFTDFELELEFQIDEHGKYNSGVYLRNDPGTASRTGYQVNIGRGAAGEFCGGVYTTDWLAKGDETDTIRKPKEWNALRILAKGAHIQVELNGKKIVDLVDPKTDPKFLQKGVIGFQTYGAEGHDGWVKFRAIRIRELTE